jgi:hypothetical protein
MGPEGGKSVDISQMTMGLHYLLELSKKGTFQLSGYVRMISSQWFNLQTTGSRYLLVLPL